MKIRTLYTIALSLVSLGASAQRMLIDDVVAVVGDDAILRSDVEAQYELALRQGANFDGDLKCYIFESLMVQKLMLNQAKLDSVMADEARVQQQADEYINQQILQYGGQEQWELYENKNYATLKKEVLEKVRNEQIMGLMNAEITKDIKITPTEIREYFRRTSKDSIPFIPAQYEISQIVLYPQVEQKEIDRVKNRLRDFQKQVAEGRDFATLAVLYSEDKGSAARGGDLGWQSKNVLVPEFSAVAFNMQEKGKVSKIVETEYGYHIIQLIERKGDRVNVRHILMNPKVSDSSRQKANDFLDTISLKLSKKEMTFEEAAMRYSMDRDTRQSGGVMISQVDGSVKFAINDIPAEIAKAIQGLKEGEWSKPFRMFDERRNKETYRIVMLRKRHEPHTANISDDYNLLQQQMLQRKQNEAVDSWIRQKQRNIYVNISPEWQNCEFEYNGWLK